MLKWKMLLEEYENIPAGLYVVRLINVYEEQIFAVAQFNPDTGWWLDPSIPEEWEISSYANLQYSIDKIPPGH